MKYRKVEDGYGEPGEGGVVLEDERPPRSLRHRLNVPLKRRKEYELGG